MSSWHSYPSIFNLGHRAVKDLLNYSHVVEEKIDGSQISFGAFSVEAVGDEESCIVGGYCSAHQTGEPHAYHLDLRVRSKGAQMNPDAPEKMFALGVERIKAIQHLLRPNWTYRGEYLQKPKHNTLAYDRIPQGHIILFDVETGDSTWLSPDEKAAEATRLGLEVVQTLWTFDARLPYNKPITLEDMRRLLDTKKSSLGGQLIEGVVIKPLVELYGPDHKTLMGKFVSERFREAHKEAWKVTSPNAGDVLDQLTKRFKVEGRWLKAIQHLRDDGKLQDAPQDIPALIAEIQRDLGQEEKEEIQKLLWKWAWPHISRNVTRGFPEYYKETLLKRQFERAYDLAEEQMEQAMFSDPEPTSNDYKPVAGTDYEVGTDTDVVESS